MQYSLEGTAGPITGQNLSNDGGDPAGGSVQGTGFQIHWQDTPLGQGARTAETPPAPS